MTAPDARPGRHFGISGRFADVPAYQIANDLAHALNRLSAALADALYTEELVPSDRTETAVMEGVRETLASAKAIRGPTTRTAPARAALYEAVLVAIGRLETARFARAVHSA